MTNWEWLEALANNSPDELQAWFDSEHVETEERALDGDTEPESEDSRELLEADVFKAADDMEMFYNGERFIDTRKIIGWLDRQAAITERECRKPNWSYCETCEALEKLTAERDELKELNEYHALQYELASEDADRLQAQVDTLQSRHCPHYDATEHTCDVHETRIAELTAERERYRSKFGKCLDYADAIHALMDDEGMA